MKEIHLVYNPLQKNYIFYEGKKDGIQRNRNEWPEENLIDGLKNTLDFDRKTILYLKAIPGNMAREIWKLLKGTKISLDKKLESN